MKPENEMPVTEGENRERCRVVETNQWAGPTEVMAIIMASIGVIVFVWEFKVEPDELAVFIGLFLVVIGFIVYGVVSHSYPKLFCSVCRKPVKDKNVRFCPECGIAMDEV